MNESRRHFQVIAAVVTLLIYTIVAGGVSWTACNCPDDATQTMLLSCCGDMSGNYYAAYSDEMARAMDVMIAASCAVCCARETSLDAQEPVPSITDPERNPVDSRNYTVVKMAFGKDDAEYEALPDTHSPPACNSANATTILLI